MNCSEVKELLSAYYDDELSPDKRSVVADHLAGCDDCGRELAEFGGLSALAEALTHPPPPAHLWQQLEEQLAVEPATKPKRTFLDGLGATRQSAVRFGLTIAAAALIAVGWFSFASRSGPDGRQMAVVFEKYLEAFRRDPRAAQQILLAHYDGQSVAAAQAEPAVGYRPAVSEGLPDGYAIDKTYVMEMPCCTCVQCICRRSDGTTLVIFEHDEEKVDWFGQRTQSEAVCNGARCSLVHLDDSMAATWSRGKRHITVVGARDTAEVERLVAFFAIRGRMPPP